MMPPKKPTKWTRTFLSKRADNIVSSNYSATTPFRPSYELKKEPVSMFRLLAMDYARQWHDEKQKIKEVIVVSNEAVFLQRRYVIRGLLRRLQQAHKEEKRFTMKKFKNIPSKYKEDTSKKSVKKQTSKASTAASKSTKTSSVERIIKTIPKSSDGVVEPCGESASDISPCSSRADLTQVCNRDDLDTRPCRKGGKKTYKEEENKIIGDEKTKPGSGKKKEGDVCRMDKAPPMKLEQKSPGKGAALIVAAKAETGQAAAAGDDGELCICACTCACTKLRNTGKDTDSKASSTLPEYKTISREDVDDQINPPVKCNLPA